MPGSSLDFLKHWSNKLPQNRTTKFLLSIGVLGIIGLIISLILVFVSLNNKGTSLEIYDSAKTELPSQLQVKDISSSECCLVEVAGAVNHPGVYQLFPESRVKDLIQKANGFHPQADPSYIATKLNLTEVIQDGLKVTIPFLSSYSTNGGVEKFKESDKVSINTATEKQLLDLPYVGQKKAADIIAGRPYRSIEDFFQKNKFSPNQQTELKNLLKNR